MPAPSAAMRVMIKESRLSISFLRNVGERENRFQSPPRTGKAKVPKVAQLRSGLFEFHARAGPASSRSKHKASQPGRARQDAGHDAGSDRRESCDAKQPGDLHSIAELAPVTSRVGGHHRIQDRW